MLISIVNCTFSRNSAAEDGAISFVSYRNSFPAIYYSCKKSFDMLDAIIEKISTVLHHQNFRKELLLEKSKYNLIVIANCTFSHNNIRNKKTKGGATVFQFKLGILTILL